jgi:hypothetical protein
VYSNHKHWKRLRKEHIYEEFDGIELDFTANKKDPEFSSLAKDLISDKQQDPVFIRLSCINHHQNTYELIKDITFNDSSQLFIHLMDYYHGNPLVNKDIIAKLYNSTSSTNGSKDLLFFNSSDVFSTTHLDVEVDPSSSKSSSFSAPSLTTSLSPTISDDTIISFPTCESSSYTVPAVLPSRISSPMRRRKTGFQDEDSGNLAIHGFLAEEEKNSYFAYELKTWGWLILASTWIVFVAGISCMLGLWNPTQVRNYTQYEKQTGYPMPIYYPSLTILCVVIVWVWCIISWMGMKFFRHARGNTAS